MISLLRILTEKRTGIDPSIVFSPDPDEIGGHIVTYDPLLTIEDDLNEVQKKMKILFDEYPSDLTFKEEFKAYVTWKRAFMQHIRQKRKLVARERR